MILFHLCNFKRVDGVPDTLLHGTFYKKLKVREKGFMYDWVRIWNGFPVSLRSIENKGYFKMKCKRTFLKRWKILKKLIFSDICSMMQKSVFCDYYAHIEMMSAICIACPLQVYYGNKAVVSYKLLLVLLFCDTSPCISYLFSILKNRKKSYMTSYFDVQLIWCYKQIILHWIESKVFICAWGEFRLRVGGWVVEGTSASGFYEETVSATELFSRTLSKNDVRFH